MVALEGLRGTGLVLATLSTNIAANIVAPANALVNVAPRRISFLGGALASCLAALFLQPWRLVDTGEVTPCPLRQYMQVNVLAGLQDVHTGAHQKSPSRAVRAITYWCTPEARTL